MTIYITGDLHGDISSFYPKYQEAAGIHIAAGDTVIICGDFGLIFSDRESLVGIDEESKLDWINRQPWNMLFIDGNHENFDMLEKFPVITFAGGKASKIKDNIFWLRRGEIYDIEGHSFFCFGGAKSVDKAWRVENVSWWAAEIPSQEEFQHALDNLASHKNKVDYVITHTVPERSMYARMHGRKSSDLLLDVCPVRNMLEQIASKIKY